MADAGDPLRGFKFAPIKPYVLESLRNSTIYFCAASSLNDPYDCHIDLASALARAVAATTGRRRALIAGIRATLIIPKIQEHWPKLGVWSFTTELNNGLIWAHYADGHKGVGFLYEMSQDLLTGMPAFVGCAPVRYGENPLTDWLVNDLSEDMDLDAACNETMQRTLTAKSQYWGYEGEGRIIRKETGSLRVPPECLKQICFGVKTDAKVERQVREAASAHRHVKFARMQRDPNSDTRLMAVDC